MLNNILTIIATKEQCDLIALLQQLDTLKLDYKKTQQHPKINPEQRSVFCQIIERNKQENRHIIYIDESGFVQEMPRTHGYSNRGSKCYCIFNWSLKNRINAIGAMLGRNLLTAVLVSCYVDTEIFTSWIERDLFA